MYKVQTVPDIYTYLLQGQLSKDDKLKGSRSFFCLNAVVGKLCIFVSFDEKFIKFDTKNHFMHQKIQVGMNKFYQRFWKIIRVCKNIRTYPYSLPPPPPYSLPPPLPTPYLLPLLTPYLLPSLLPTSSVLLAEVWEPPDVPEADAEPEDGEEELDRTVPRHPAHRQQQNDTKKILFKNGYILEKIHHLERTKTFHKKYIILTFFIDIAADKYPVNVEFFI